MDQQSYTTLRIINACLRENVSSLVSLGKIIDQEGSKWLYVDHLEYQMRIRVTASDYMQSWVAEHGSWQVLYEKWMTETGYHQWLSRLMHGYDNETQSLFLQFIEEAGVACEHGRLCQQIYHKHTESLMRPLSEQTWGERLRHSDQIASFLDHPYYPTARAKFGLSKSELKKYAPENAQPFYLHWLAIKRELLTLTETNFTPIWWPTFSEVGLDNSLFESHFLLPIHPLTWQQVVDTLPDSTIAAPRTFLPVFPTLSVRTVQLSEYPEQHLKLPLAIRTLGHKNIRLIKASTLYDGQWFADTLSLLVNKHPYLHNRYRHVDERFCGHVGDEKLFAFLLRRYPKPLDNETLVPVAALASLLPDGRPYICHLLEQNSMPNISMWWQEYCQLMSDVHLTLWLCFGLALESNQQNSVLSFTPGKPLSLVMKDNDAARLWPDRFISACPEMVDKLDQLIDDRIKVDNEQALAQMFITITLQLCLASVLEGLADSNVLDRKQGYQVLTAALNNTLEKLEILGVETSSAQQYLFESDYQPVKYLLLSGSLLSKQASGVTDINKFYGYSGPNFLRRYACEVATY